MFLVECVMKRFVPLLVVGAMALALTTTISAHDGESVSRVFGGISLKAGGVMGDGDTVNGGISIGNNAKAEDLETVNGGITVGAAAIVGRLETVNGGIDIEDNATVISAEAVNGGVDVGDGVRISQSLETVNGAIEIGARSEVLGEVENVNGGIRIGASHVVGKVSTVSGDLTLSGSRLDNGILIEKQGWAPFRSARKPIVKIGAGSVVNGTLEFRREVELFVHPTAKIGRVIGATVRVLQ